MTHSKKTVSLLLVVLLGFLLFESCATLGQLGAALANLRRLKFRLSDVTDFALLGIRFSRIGSISDFNAMDALRLVQGFATKRFPAEFVLNIEAQNPNDGTGGSRQTVSTLTSLESRLLIDGVTTVTGNIDRALEIPGTGQSSTIPLRMSIDLYEFFGNKGYEGILNLALALGGMRRDTSRISLDAQPRVSTPIGEIVYPGRLTIISHEFR